MASRSERHLRRARIASSYTRRRQSLLSVSWALRPARRRVFPVLLPSVGREVENVRDEHEPVNSSSSRAVGSVDILSIANEDAEHETGARSAVVRKRGAPG